MFEKGDREYVKARLKDFRKLTADTRKLVDDIEKEAGKWSTAKDPQKAFDKSGEPLGKRAKDQQKALDKLSEKGTKGGNTQVLLLKAFRPLEELQGALGPEIGKDEKFAEALKTIRAALDESEAAFTDIEKDETLIASKFAKTGEEGADRRDGDEGAKPDDAKARPSPSPSAARLHPRGRARIRGDPAYNRGRHVGLTLVLLSSASCSSWSAPTSWSRAPRGSPRASASPRWSSASPSSPSAPRPPSSPSRHRRA
jgi:hypothetical protein